ncbi:TROVE domain-containing protein [Hymenobacter sp. GOD-10R]|uniref:TROVE domain-containing protein n=1 Tax=Hymenobacter sp. GOD-10R TaxID=3093922 RepID=UPI002D798473|nr:TROVE domain-containing protein [Hymenobacter sp. GOD-10R]WRQ30396.1 TROVE domain-containing protein [Hymenobacter sp. GOD-10R]
MALLRNLRNIIEVDVSADAVQTVCATLANRAAVARSKQLPFRFLAAYREVLELKLGRVPGVLAALETAIGHSVANLRGFDANTRVLLACDVSGSMQQPISARSKVLLYDIGLVLAMLLQSRCQHVVTGMFGDKWKRISLPTGQVLRNVQEMYRREGEVGYSTNGHLVVYDLRQRREVVDKVMIFTDCQLWDSTGRAGSLAAEWREYRRTVAPQAQLYLFDLAGHGTAPLQVRREDGVALVAGWSDKVFDVLAALEDGGSALTEIEKVEF